MMALSDLLEDFSTERADTAVVMTELLLEEERLEAFEKGYKAGWDDSANAQTETATSISEDFASNLRDLAFTYEEAHDGMLSAIEPVIRQIVDTVLPAIAHETLGLRVADLLKTELSTHGRQPVRLETAPESAPAIRAILPHDCGFPLEIVETDMLGEGQVRIRFGPSNEQEVDLERVISGIRSATDAFFHQISATKKETA